MKEEQSLAKSRLSEYYNKWDDFDLQEEKEIGSLTTEARARE
jgi:hypothetical protein